MPIDWNLANTPVSTQAPPTGLAAFAGGLNSGLQAGQQIAGTAQQQVQSAEMFPLQKEAAQQAVDTGKIAQLQSQYQLAQSILGPAAAAIQQGDQATAAKIYTSGYQALQKAGIDPSKFGAPAEFDPNFVMNAYQDVSSQMKLAKQMMEMSGMQADMAYKQSQVNRNNAEIGKINYETGGAFTYPGQDNGASQPEETGVGTGATMMAPQNNTTQKPVVDMNPSLANVPPKLQAEVKQKQIESFLDLRTKAETAAKNSELDTAQIDKALELLSNKSDVGLGNKLRLAFDTDIQKLDKIYNGFAMQKIQTDYAGNGLGSLDVAVFNTIKSSLPQITDILETQRDKLRSMKVAQRAIQMSNEVGRRLQEMGVMDPQLLNAIGGKILEKLKTTDGKFTESSFNNADKVIDETIKEYSEKGSRALTPNALKDDGVKQETQVNNARAGLVAYYQGQGLNPTMAETAADNALKLQAQRSKKL